MKKRQEIEKDIMSRLKYTEFNGNVSVSTVENSLSEHPLAELRNEMFGYFPFETAIINDNAIGADRTLVVRHSKTSKQALKNHKEIVEQIEKAKKMNWKYWHGERDKAFKKLMRKK